VNQNKDLVPVTKMSDQTRGTVTMSQLFMNSIFTPIWKKFKDEVNLDDVTNSPVQFYQFQKNNLWKLFRAQLLSNDHVLEKAKRSKASINKFMKYDFMAINLAFELTRIWLIDGNITNQFLQDMKQRKKFNTAMHSIHNQVIRDGD
jgi:hypothetical protein